MPDLEESLDFVAAYNFNVQHGTGDMDFHLREHVLRLEAESDPITLVIAQWARNVAKLRQNPWL